MLMIYLSHCRFSDCRHETEPSFGALRLLRWKREWNKGMARFTKQRKKEIL